MFHTCDFNGCYNKFPDHHLSRYCGDHSKEEIACDEARIHLSGLLASYHSPSGVRERISEQIVALGALVIPTICTFLEEKHAAGMNDSQAYYVLDVVRKMKAKPDRTSLCRLVAMLAWKELLTPFDRGARMIIYGFARRYGTSDMIPLFKEIRPELERGEYGVYDRNDIDDVIRAMEGRPAPIPEPPVVCLAPPASESAFDGIASEGTAAISSPDVATPRTHFRRVLPRLGSRDWLLLQTRRRVMHSANAKDDPRPVVPLDQPD